MCDIREARRVRNAQFLASIPKRRELTKEETERALRACNLLNAMRETFGMGDIASLGAAGLKGPYCRYLHDLSLIPDAALEFFREALLPASDFRIARIKRNEVPT
ncbi:MAG TPA: hypothetical protein VHC68_00215 [Candidatus Paceibacterota bacterium]|nr:hypothetical protein [Candidatus Paceibacterota bacterium]